MLRGLPRFGGSHATLDESTTKPVHPMATYADSIMANLAEAEEKMAEMKALSEKLRAELLSEVITEHNGKFAGVYGKVTVCKRDSYTFSDQVTILEENLKAQKAIEKKTKVATVSGTKQYVTINWN